MTPSGGRSESSPPLPETDRAAILPESSAGVLPAYGERLRRLAPLATIASAALPPPTVVGSPEIENQL